MIFQGAQSGGWFWLWVSIVGVAALLIILLLRQERRLVSRPAGLAMLTLRLAVLATLFATVMQPVLTWTLDKRQRGYVLVSLDVSDSMSTADEQASRAEKLRWARALGMYGNEATDERLDDWQAALEEGREPEWVSATESPDPQRRAELAAARRENLEGVFRELGRLSRREIAFRLLTKTRTPLLTQLSDVAEVQTRVFARRVQVVDAVDLEMIVDEPPLTLDPGVSNLSQAMTSAESPLLGVVLLTDGRDTSGRDPVNTAAQLGALAVPVCPVLLGSEYRPRDLSIGTMDYPQTVFLDDNAVLSAEVLASGFDGDPVLVRLTRDGNPVGERTVAAVDGATRVEFTLDASTAGRRQYQLTVSPQPGETREDNNVAGFAMTVVDDRARVLLIDGEARWEFRFLHRALERDERVELASVVFEQPYLGQLNSSFFASELRLPDDIDDIDNSPLADVDVVIVGDVAPANLDDRLLSLLERYVSEFGGTVVFQAGKRHMPIAFDSAPLSRLLPISRATVVNMRGLDQTGPPRDRGMHLFVTAEALDEPMFQFVEDRFANRRFWTSLPGHTWAVVAEAKPGANVFASVYDPKQAHDVQWERKNALVAHQFYGFGQVLWMGIDSTWRWRFRTGDRYHHRFWGQLARWAATNKASAGNANVRLKLSGTELQQGDDLDITALWSRQQLVRQPDSQATALVSRLTGADTQPFATVQLEPEDGRTRAHKARLLSLPAGGYRVELLVNGQAPDEPIQAEFFVHEQKSLELSDVSCNKPLLQRIADVSGGRVFQADEISQIADLFKDKDQTTSEPREIPLWTHWSVMLLFFGLLTAEWIVRKLNGLP